MYCKDSEKLHYKEFVECMKYLKNNKEGEEKITVISLRRMHRRQQSRLQKKLKEKQAVNEAKKNTLKDMAIKLLKCGDSVEAVVEITSLPLESVCALQL